MTGLSQDTCLCHAWDKRVKQSGESKPAELAALKEGQRAEALFTGQVRESYPVRATAAEITNLEEYEWVR
jgi:hypothetical protein